MALMKCPECGRMVSDEAESCPQCGYVLSKEGDKPSGKGTLILISAIVVVLIAIALVSVYFVRLNARKNYIENLSAIRTDMLSTGIKAEEAATLVHDVWYNTIFKKSDAVTNKYAILSYKYDSENFYYSDRDFNSDFNQSLQSLFRDDEFSHQISVIRVEYERISKKYGELQNPPDGLELCYSTLGEMYNAFQVVVRSATDPSGNLTSYTSAYREAEDSFVANYEKLNGLLSALE